jgi:hypothetical protein
MSNENKIKMGCFQYMEKVSPKTPERLSRSVLQEWWVYWNPPTKSQSHVKLWNENTNSKCPLKRNWLQDAQVGYTYEHGFCSIMVWKGEIL